MSRWVNHEHDGGAQNSSGWYRSQISSQQSVPRSSIAPLVQLNHSVSERPVLVRSTAAHHLRDNGEGPLTPLAVKKYQRAPKCRRCAVTPARRETPSSCWC